MHNTLRLTCPEPGTPEGHFVNENTVVRLAAMMEIPELKLRDGPRRPRCVPKEQREAWRKESFGAMLPAEKAVRVLFLFRHLILHAAGVLRLDGRRGKWEEWSYDWFCDQHGDARVREGEELRLPADAVITPIIDACEEYVRQHQCSSE